MATAHGNSLPSILHLQGVAVVLAVSAVRLLAYAPISSLKNATLV